ncbi:IS21 family transposase [bacterium]|nr:IS21 family transposase [bacterium]
MIRNDYVNGLSISEIARKYNINWRTAKKYAVSDKMPKYERKNRKETKLEPYKDYIRKMLDEANLTAKKVLEKIERMGYEGKYGIVKIFVHSIKEEKFNQAVMRFETMPGKQSQVDWGTAGTYIDENGKKKYIYFFTMILGYSRMRYVEFVTSMKEETFLKCHINAFHYFGGYTEEILYDNMKQIVLKRFVGKPHKLNPVFADFAGFYGFKPILARPYRPQTKGKIERTVGYVKQDFLPGEPMNIIILNNNIKNWLEKVNSKIHTTTNEIPYERLKRENLNTINNRKDYEYEVEEKRKVSKDCFVSYKGVKYSIYPKYVKKEVAIKRVNGVVNFYYKNNKVAEHRVSKDKKTVIKKEHFRALYEQNGINIDEIDLSVYDNLSL